MYQYAYIMIKTPQYKIKIYGQTLHDNMKFKDSDLFPLYTLILQKNVSLKPKKVLDADVEGWYESKWKNTLHFTTDDFGKLALVLSINAYSSINVQK